MTLAGSGRTAASVQERRDKLGRTGAAAWAERVSSPGEDQRKKMELLGEREDKMEVNQVTWNDRVHAHERVSLHHLLSLQALAGELEREKERRAKAELAAERLVEHVHSLQCQMTEGQRRHELAVVRMAEMKEQLKREREGSKALEAQTHQLEVSQRTGSLVHWASCGF